jgi:hypothetical protein
VEDAFLCERRDGLVDGLLRAPEERLGGRDGDDGMRGQLDDEDPKITERRYGHLLPDFVASEGIAFGSGWIGSRRVLPPS